MVQLALEIEQAPTGVSLTAVITDVDGSDEPPYLGDVIVSLPRAREQAAEHGHSTMQELRLLVVHGVLHLLGYDHATPAEEAAMWARQDAILQRVQE